MYAPRLQVDTTANAVAGPSSASSSAAHRPVYGRTLSVEHIRGRSLSNASSSSTLSIVSPATSSNGSTSSLEMQTAHADPKPASANNASAKTSLGPGDFVLALHDYSPQSSSATCLSFRAGQVIHVLNRDTSGWWDGELEGRRGWFPSNYVDANPASLTEEEEGPISPRAKHSHSQSAASVTSWMSVSSGDVYESAISISDTMGVDDTDVYCPPIMIPLLNGLSLLQNAVRADRIAHFQPSTACIISCVRSILSGTGTLQRESSLLQDFPVLAAERRRILAVLASLVAKAKQASDPDIDDRLRDENIDEMMRLSGQVFAHMRRYLAVAVHCGVDLPVGRDLLTGSPDTARRLQDSSSDGDLKPRTPRTYDSPTSSESRMPVVQQRATSARNVVQLRPLEQAVRTPKHRQGASVSSNSSSGSFTSSAGSSSPVPSKPSFPSGPASVVQVLDALRLTHDEYLSTIAALIGYTHMYSRASHASSTGHMYELVREIVDKSCRLLTIVDAVMQHPGVPDSRIGNLSRAKDGLFDVTSALAEAVRVLTVERSPTVSEDTEKGNMLYAATAALKAGSDCAAAIKMCLTRTVDNRPILFASNDEPQPRQQQQQHQARQHDATPMREPKLVKSSSSSALAMLANGKEDDEDLTIQAQTPSPLRLRQVSSGSESASSRTTATSQETSLTSPEDAKAVPGSQLARLAIADTRIEPDLPSPSSMATSFAPSLARTGTTWEGSIRSGKDMEEKIFNLPLDSIPELPGDPMALLSHDYDVDAVAYNTDGHLVGATLDVLVEKMTPHDSIVDPAFSAVFFMTFRMFSSPAELLRALIVRYNVVPPRGVSAEGVQLWQQRKGIPVRLRVSNFIKSWAETYWRSGVDDGVLPDLAAFTHNALAVMFPGPAQRILDLLDMRRRSMDTGVSPRGDRSRDPGMSINPATSLVVQPSEIPRPTMTKTLLAALRAHNFASISITDFDALELARQMTIMECNLYCAIQPEEVLETGQAEAKPVNVKAMSSLSTVITGWVAESILNEADAKKRTALVKFFIKLADRCTALNNFSTSRSVLAALDSSTIARLHQTWNGLPQKNKLQLEAMRKLADHSRNYREYRARLRNTAPPAVPFLGLYLTDITFCREGNPSHRASPTNQTKQLINFNKYHKLARIVQDMQRFQAPYNLKEIPEVHEYLTFVFQKSRRNGDLQDLYRRSLMVEPKRSADAPPVTPATEVKQLFPWTSRSASQPQPI
ncbi:ras guanine nucleotide exchange factor domain-containing protein [Schizophyllum amplum]|uniref:Ras guanine nucleotide exchange factor domain-containing protein n=1 Tax=Schizophyllum amplum TaxID=97359 RepID=A0A550CH25_9AGAR|nr:ras guanine nucleotide exchange factor domain-containing protein [Auriculariopsis ampla]